MHPTAHTPAGRPRVRQRSTAERSAGPPTHLPAPPPGCSAPRTPASAAGPAGSWPGPGGSCRRPAPRNRSAGPPPRLRLRPAAHMTTLGQRVLMLLKRSSGAYLPAPVGRARTSCTQSQSLPRLQGPCPGPWRAAPCSWDGAALCGRSWRYNFQLFDNRCCKRPLASHRGLCARRRWGCRRVPSLNKYVSGKGGCPFVGNWGPDCGTSSQRGLLRPLLRPAGLRGVHGTLNAPSASD